MLLTAAPFLTGILLRITAMQQILGPIGLVNMALMELGLPPVEVLMYTNVASAVGLIYLWIPFMLLAIYLSLFNFNFRVAGGGEGERRQAVAGVPGGDLAAQLDRHGHRHRPRVHPHLRRLGDAALPGRARTARCS